MNDSLTGQKGAEDYLPTKTLRAAYRDLTEEDEVVLATLAMLGTPLSSDQAVSLCECLRAEFRGRFKFARSVPRLMDGGLVEPIREGTRKTVVGHVAHRKLGPWGLAASRHRYWEEITEACAGYVERKWGHLDPDACPAFVRYAVVSGNTELANYLLRRVSDAWVDGCVSIARDATDHTFDCVHPGLWAGVLSTLQRWAPGAPETAHLFEVLARGVARDNHESPWPTEDVRLLRFAVASARQEACLIGGELAEGEKLCELPEGGTTSLGLAFRWLRGAYTTDEYIERRMAGPPGTKKKFQPTWPALAKMAWGEAFYALALVADGSAPRVQEALRLAKTARKHVDSYQPLATEIEMLASRILDKPFRFDGRQLHLPVQPADDVTDLVRAIVDAWTPETVTEDEDEDDGPDDGARLGPEDIYQEILSLDESPWLQRQWLALLRRLDEQTAQKAADELGSVAVAPQGERCLVDLLESKTRWERQFEALERSLSGQPEAESQAEERLAWFVGVEPALQIEPRVQKRKGNGYTRGRRVAIKRLVEGDEPCDLTEHDRRVVNRVEADVVPTSYYYSRTEYDLPDEALVELIGHPAVFDMGTCAPLLVQEGTPQISLSKQGSELRFVATPPSADSVSYTMRDGALIVYSLNKRQQEIFSKVLRAGWFPEKARDRATRLLESMATTVHTMDDKKALGDVRNVPAEAAPVFQLKPHRSGLKVQVVVRPFGPAGPFFSPGAWPESVRWDAPDESLAAVRELKRELSSLAVVLEDCPMLARYLEEQPQFQAEVQDTQDLLEIVTELTTRAARVEWPEGEKIRIRRAGRGTIKVTNVRNNDWLEAQMTVDLDDGDQLEQLELLQALRSQQRFVALPDGSFVELEQSLRSRLQRMDAFSSPDEQAGLYHPFAALELEQDETLEVVGDKSWRKRREELAAKMRQKIRLPTGLKTELRDYQKEGVRWALRLANLGAGACLADDMGLGKTVQALAVLLVRAKEGPAIVLAPSSVIGNWSRELAEFAPGLRVIVLSEVTARTSEGKRKLPSLKTKDVMLATYDLAVRETEGLRDVGWATLVIDEAQAIKNPDTRRARAVTELQAGFRMALSGTPVENHLGELWSLFRVLNPTLLGTRKVFETRFQRPIEQADDSARLEQLKALVAPFLLRRTKEAVLSSLPPRTEVTWEVELSKAERTLYEAARVDAVERLDQESRGDKNPLQILKELLRLRQLCCHPRLALPNSTVPSSKHAALMELLEELRENGHRALIFSQFVQHLSLVRELLDRAGFSYQYLDGSTPTAERTRRIEAFQEGTGELFLISLKAGGTGVNLTAADYVIHLDPWWNPAVEDQASDRAHRIGQTKPVTVYRLVAKNTIEEKLIALHSSKRELADQVLSGGQAAAQFSGEELLRLMTGG